MSKEPQVAIVRVKNSVAGDVIFSTDQWVAEGKYKGFIKTGMLNIKEIEGIEYGFMDFTEFHSLREWEG